MSYLRRQLSGPSEGVAQDAGWGEDAPARKGFFTDTSICIGCKACEVACKEWNAVPMDGLGLSGNSYDNTRALGASTWRHVAFVEQGPEQIERARESGRKLVSLGMPSVGPPGTPTDPGSDGTLDAAADRAGQAAPTAASSPVALSTRPIDMGSTETGTLETGPLGPIGVPAPGQPGVPALPPDFRWLMASDVCKHCTHAGCLDVCPTGALFRTEFGTVVVQADTCNGCGYCVGACPFGVIERRRDEGSDGVAHRGTATDSHVPNVGVAQKCTLCYDRIGEDQTPACAQTCPTTSIRFGDHDDMVTAARERVTALHDQGFPEARLYGANDDDGVGGIGSVFLLLDEPEVYGLPPDPVVSTAHLPEMARQAGLAAAGLAGAVVLAFLGGRR